MTFDPNKYLDHVEQFDLTHDQKLELINNVRQIMQSAVDRTFDCDATQLVLSSRGEIADAADCQVDNYTLSDIAKDAFDGSLVLNLKVKQDKEETSK